MSRKELRIRGFLGGLDRTAGNWSAGRETPDPDDQYSTEIQIATRTNAFCKYQTQIIFSTLFRMAFSCVCMESINVFPRFGLRSPPAVGHFGDGWVGEEGFVIQIGTNIASVINIIAKSQHHHQNHLHHRVASAIFNNSINSSIQIFLFLRGLSKLASNPKTSILNS